MAATYFYYKAFGLTFRSEIEHPEFVPVAETDSTDCIIRFGKVPENLDNPDKVNFFYQRKKNVFLLKVKKVGRYLIENGYQITIEKMPDAPDRKVRIFLWASAVAALMHQRGMLIIHGSTVKSGESAILFGGHSGSGKSTLTAAFAGSDSSRIVADDISAIALNSHGLPVVLPGYPVIKLWKDSSDKLGLVWDEEKLVRKKENKMIVNTCSLLSPDPISLKQIYLLNYKNNGAASISEIAGFAKIGSMAEKIFRKGFMSDKRDIRQPVYEILTRVASQVRLCRLERQYGMEFFDDTCAAIRNDLLQTGIII